MCWKFHWTHRARNRWVDIEKSGKASQRGDIWTEGIWKMNTNFWNFFFLSKMLFYFLREVSLQFSRSVVFNSLQLHGLQHARPPCPSPTPRVYSNYVYWVGDAIQPSHPLSSPSPPTFNLSQHQGLFKWVSSLHQVAKVLEFQLQHQSFQWIFRTDFL